MTDLIVVGGGPAGLYAAIRAASLGSRVILLERNDRLGKKLVVTAFDTDKYYFDADLSKGTALVIGNEGNGVSAELMDMADIKVKIPMDGNLESLNASVAAGILMYETKRRRD